MPGMGDPRFQRSVIYMLAHDGEGAMGLIINQQVKGVTLGDVAKILPASVANTGLTKLPIFIGGPVQNDTIYALHTNDYEKTAHSLTDNLPVHLTQSVEVLADAAKGQGPKDLRLFLGYTGWGPEQLESELQENAWLVAPCDIAQLFTSNTHDIYTRTLTSLGIDLALLSQAGGEA